MSRMAKMSLDTIIIGAGWSGAVAANHLKSKGYNVLILEARDRVGGRAKTWQDSEGKVKVDVGCSWIHGYREGNPARKITEEKGLAAHEPKAAEGYIYGPNGVLPSSTAAALRASLSAAQSAASLPHPVPPPTASLASALLSKDSPLFSSSAKPDPSSDANQTNPADPTTVPEKAKSSAGPDHAELAAGLARLLEVPLGVKLEKASLRWAGWENLTNFSGSDAAPQGGYEALVGRVLKDSGADIKLNTTATMIKSDSTGGVTITDQAGQTYTAKTVICTIPLGVLKTLPSSFFEPPLPPRMQEAIKGTHVGVLEKLVMVYREAWWPNAKEAGSYTFLPTSTNPVNEKSTPRQILDASTIMVANFAGPSLPNPTPTLLGYLSETPALGLLKHDITSVSEAFHQYLVDRFGANANQPPLPIQSSMTDWYESPFSRGATTTPSIVSENGERSPMDFKELGRPVWEGKLGFAGEATDMEHRGSVAGAVVSGQREAERVDRLLRKWKEA